MRAISRRTKVASTIATVVAFSVITPTAAFADSEPLAGKVRTDSSSTWTHYSTVRVTTGSRVAFKPRNLLFQGGNVSALNLRLEDGESRNVTGRPISGAVLWTNDYRKKTIKSGMARNTRFRIGACCYSYVGQDRSWSGTLYR